MKLSIIIPVYNAENTLDKCVKSVLNNVFGDYELILVDDGSADSSSRICDGYAAKDARINVIHKQNGGLSSARNVGISRAKGAYITFIDSDDTVSADTYAKLMHILEAHKEYDMLEYPVFERYGNAAIEHLLNFHGAEYTDVEDYWFGAKAYTHAYACNKIYRRELFNDVAFPMGKAFEDIHTLPQILNKCGTIATTGSGLYYYNYNDKGITSTAGGKELGDLLDAHIRLVGTELSPLKSAKYYAHVLNIQLDVYRLTGKEPTLPPLPAGINDKLTLKLIIYKLIGIKGLCQLNKYIHRKRKT